MPAAALGEQRAEGMVLQKEFAFGIAKQFLGLIDGEVLKVSAANCAVHLLVGHGHAHAKLTRC